MASEPPARSGILPPDGVPWPPQPPDRSGDGSGGAPAGGQVDWSVPTPARRPDDADVADWRAMPVDVPPGYHGSSSAPPAPAPRLDAWSVVAFVCALVGAVPLTWALPVLSVLAVPFGLAGRRNCQLDPTLRGRLLATAAVVIGVATVAAVGVLLATGHLSIGTGSG